MKRQPRQYEIRKTQRWSNQSGLAFADTPEEALSKAEELDDGEEGYYVRIREYELSGIPGLPPIRPDRHLSVSELREEVRG